MKKSPIFRLSLALASAVGCGAAEEMSQDELAQAIGKEIATACPMASPADEQARVQCTAKLTDAALLKEHISEPFLWGGQKTGKGYRLDDSDTTRFNAFVWRRMYLSLFMFTGEVKTETVGDTTVIHLPFHFRNELDMGSYPYPFWHSKTKWDSWQLSPELVIVMEKKALIGALRANNFDEGRRAQYNNRAWDGQWRWKEGGQDMPFVSLYSFLFSKENPHVAALDTAYRDLESELRGNACLVCHAPDNFAKTGQLEFFNFPNQALYSRHSIVMHLTNNTMPPKNDYGFPMGLADDSARQELLKLAKAFEKVGDDALKFEGELRPWSPPPAPKM
jgi:hypothetical protein